MNARLTTAAIMWQAPVVARKLRIENPGAARPAIPREGLRGPFHRAPPSAVDCPEFARRQQAEPGAIALPDKTLTIEY